MRPNSQVAQLGLLGLGLLLLLAVFGCGSGSQEGSPNYDTQLEQPAESPMQNRPPCVGADEMDNSCEARDVSLFDLSRSDLFSSRQRGSAQFYEGTASTVEEVLEKGLRLEEASPVHIAFRGAARQDSVRCDLRGVARTPDQREAAIRFWLDLDDDEALPSSSEVERLFMEELDKVSPAYPESARANFRTLARGGSSTDYLFLTCFVDYDADEYVLGDGPDPITVAHDHMAEVRSYELYSRAHAAGEFGDEVPFPRAHIRRHEPSSDRPWRGKCRLVCPKAMGPSLAKMELSLPVTLRQIRRS